MKQIEASDLTIIVSKKPKSKYIFVQSMLFALVVFACVVIWYSTGLIHKMKPLTPLKLNGHHKPTIHYKPDGFKRKRKGLLILTYHRSGSTFLGQYFNQRPDVFYAFEPLITFEDYCFVDTDEELKLQHLTDLFNCRLRDQKEIFKRAGKPEDGETVRGDAQRCIPNNFCFRQKIKRFCSEKFCKHGFLQTCTHCEAVDLEAAAQQCAASEIVVIKVIRLCQLKNLMPLLQDPTLDFKILHLVRDPRGVYNSRDKVLEENVDMLVNTTCRIIHENAQFLLDEKDEDWVKRKYKIIRYEDLCVRPLQVAEGIYKFVGLNMTPEMHDWILNNTQESVVNLGDAHGHTLAKNMYHSKHLRSLDVKSKLDYVKKKLLSSPYTTTRNSSANWMKWVKELDDKKLKVVQSTCGQMMQDIGYKTLDNLNVTETSQVITSTCPNNLINYCTFS